MDKINIVKSLLYHIGNDPDQDEALVQAAILTLETMEKPKPKPEPKQEEAKPAPKQKKNKPFDTGKLRALRSAGWSVAKIADEMSVSEPTIYKHMKKEGIA